MANFAQMSTSKLNALLENEQTTPEQKAEIQVVLNKRAKVVNKPADEVSAPQETPAKAEAKTPGRKAEVKLTEEERIALAEKLRAEVVHHRCEVVPFGTIEWVPGTIVGLMEDKRTNKVMYAVQTDDNRRVVKIYGSQLIKISDEVVEPQKKTRGPKVDENGNPIVMEPWTDEQIEEEVKKVLENVGKKVAFKETGAFGRNEGDVEPVTVNGRIVSLVIVRRSRSLQYRILVDGTNKFVHKVTTVSGLTIEPTFDEEGEAINKHYIERRYAEKKERVNMSKEEKLETYKASLAKAEEKLAYWQKIVDDRKARLEALQNEANETTETPDTQKPETQDFEEDLL